MRPLDRPAASAPAEPGSQAPFANGQLRSTKPHPPRKWPIPSPAATPPSSQSSFLRIKWQATNQRGKSESSAVLTYDWFQGIDALVPLQPALCSVRISVSSSLLVVMMNQKSSLREGLQFVSQVLTTNNHLTTDNSTRGRTT